MLTLLLENPIWIGLTGVLFSCMAIVLWTQLPDRKSQRIAFVSALVLSGLTIFLVVLNILVQTERERIEDTLHTVSAALEKNDLPTVYSYIHPNATEGLQRAKGELPQYHFNDARVTRIKDIQVNLDTKPNTAVAEFNVVVDVNVGQNKGRAARFVRVYFMQRDGRWLVRDYEHFEPTAGFRSLP